jgi:hypothetical protein
LERFKSGYEPNSRTSRPRIKNIPELIPKNSALYVQKRGNSKEQANGGTISIALLKMCPNKNKNSKNMSYLCSVPDKRVKNVLCNYVRVPEFPVCCSISALDLKSSSRRQTSITLRFHNFPLGNHHILVIRWINSYWSEQVLILSQEIFLLVPK